jgi:hypothetical protein
MWQIKLIRKMKIIGRARPVDGTVATINVVQTYHPLRAYS